MHTKNHARILIAGAKQFGVELTIAQVNQLLQYLSLLRQWNKVHNLCAKSSYENMLAYHILDSISLAMCIDNNNQQILDVGTGAGLPAIPLAIVRSACQITALDPKEKKISFIRHAINSLQLANVVVNNSRLENYHPAFKFNIIVSRAFASLEKFVKLASRLCWPGGVIIAMKSTVDLFRIDNLIGDDCKITDLKTFKVPGVANQRSLVIIKKH